jgi:hypothetical protein
MRHQGFGQDIQIYLLSMQVDITSLGFFPGRDKAYISEQGIPVVRHIRIIDDIPAIHHVAGPEKARDLASFLSRPHC